MMYTNSIEKNDVGGSTARKANVIIDATNSKRSGKTSPSSSSHRGMRFSLCLLLLSITAIVCIIREGKTMQSYFDGTPTKYIYQFNVNHDPPGQNILVKDKDTIQIMNPKTNPSPTKKTQEKTNNEMYFDNILLQGQFNYPDTPVDRIQVWTETWSKYFKYTVAVGPFTSETQTNLTKLGIRFRYGPENHSHHKRDPRPFGSLGTVSPYANLLNTIQEIVSIQANLNNNDDNDDDLVHIDGVLFIHDDLIVNLTDYTVDGTFPSDTIITNHDNMHMWFDPKREKESSYYVRVVDSNNNNNNTMQQQRSNRTTIQYWDNRKWFKYDNYTILWQKGLAHWDQLWRKICGKAVDEMARDSRIQDYLDPDGYWYVPGNRYSDNLYIPKIYFHDYIEVAKFHADYGNFLECAVPSIVTMIQHRRNGPTAYNESLSPSSTLSSLLPNDVVKVKEVALCTRFGSNKGMVPAGHPGVIHSCLTGQPKGFRSFGVFHPVKSSWGFDWFREMVDLVQQGGNDAGSWKAYNWTKQATPKLNSVCKEWYDQNKTNFGLRPFCAIEPP